MSLLRTASEGVSTRPTQRSGTPGWRWRILRRRASGSDATASQHAAPSRTLAWLSVVLFVSLTTFLLTGVVEWEHYRRLLRWQRVDQTLLDRTLLFWLLWAKSWLLFTPLVSLVGLLIWSKKARTARVVLGAGWTLLIFWLGIDLWVQRWLGNHVSDYLPYLHDVLAAGVDANHKEWAGDSWVLIKRCLSILAMTLLGGWSTWRFSLLAARKLASIGPRRWQAWHWGMATSSAAALCLGVCVPAVLHGQPLLLQRLESVLPVNLPLASGSTGLPARLRGWLGWHSDEQAPTGVRIVAVLPDPPGEDAGQERVDLHNFSKKVVSLKGWQLLDRVGKRFPLQGSLAPGRTRRIVIGANTLTLDDSGDEVLLVDAHSNVRHRVEYRSDDVKYGALVTFRGNADLTDFLVQVNRGTQQAYEELYEQVMTPRGVDPAARVDRADAPNVILLVLESFRDSAVSERLLARLNAWGGTGLRAARHYAGSNSSHLGLFALLYGRSPLLYDPTLDAQVPPQWCYSLRHSGYECSFVTSGDCNGFRRMDGYLNDHDFDHVIIKGGAGWRDWPERDHQALQEVRQQLAGAAGRPQFVMAFLMCTHIPYAYPPEFEIRKPVATDVAGDEWRNCNPRELLNRYSNAALYLESELMNLIETLDPARNIVIVTGDHGESMSEDGALCHGTRASEVQTRVPLLMVGGNIAPQRVEQPTTHADVLPTLLHALAEKHVDLAHGHGRDLLGTAELLDQVLICPYRWREPYDLVLIKQGERLNLKIRLDRPAVEAFGFHDTSGNLDLESAQRYSGSDADRWVTSFRDELRRITR